MKLPGKLKFERARRQFDGRGKFSRDPTYKTGRRLVELYRDSSSELADGLGVVIVHWNHAFYRYGRPDFSAFEACLLRHQESIASLGRKDLPAASQKDLAIARELFEEFLEALAGINRKTGAKRRSAVATVKALHLLAPSFFPLWDATIARAYGCSYRGTDPSHAYMCFLTQMKALLAHLEEVGVKFPEDGRTRLKAVDEYNFTTYAAPAIYGP